MIRILHMFGFGEAPWRFAPSLFLSNSMFNNETLWEQHGGHNRTLGTCGKTFGEGKEHVW